MADSKIDYEVAIKIMGKVDGVDVGIFPEHDWVREDDGQIDEWAMEDYEGVHHGPRCRRCYYSYCVNCPPEPDPGCRIESTCYSGNINRAQEVAIKARLNLRDISYCWQTETWSIAGRTNRSLPELICRYALDIQQAKEDLR